MVTPVHSSLEAIDRLLDRMDRLHSSPAVAYRVLELLKNPEFDIQEVAGLLETDPALAASILRLVNSSCHGLTHPIASIPQAVAYIGTRSLRLAVLSFGLVDRLTRGTPQLVCRDYWRRAMTMASAAAQLCTTPLDMNAVLLGDAVEQVPPDEAYSAGLLADIGVLVLAQVETEQYVAMYDELGHGSELVQAERREFGFSHATLGAKLLAQWKLPTRLTLAVARHDSVKSPPSSMVGRAVVAADLLADALWTPQSPRLPEAQAFLAENFDLDIDGFISLAVACKADIARNSELFRVELTGSIDCEELRNQASNRFRIEAMETAMDWDSMTAFREHDYS
ncbi:MAG TPA: HDOD domain-containing protein [Thermoguttaceae bacterium]|nr:HDOD domain-containing protein [Thermoguttaceae bacterium]